VAHARASRGWRDLFAEIAQRGGFADQSHFARLFKRHFAMTWQRAAFAASVALLTGGCSLAAAGAPEKCGSSAPPAIQTQVVAAANDLGFALLRAKQNAFISPLSIAQALGVVYLGARGDTAKAFVKSSVAPPIDPAEFACASQNIRAALPQTDSGVTLQLANALWVAQGLALKDSFVEAARTGFGADVTPLDFGNPDAVRTINAWVNARTRGHISAILNHLNGADAVVTNAVYFKGLWDHAFAASQTASGRFFGAAGPTHVRFMNQTATFGYYAGAGFQLVRLGYRGDRFAMYVVLPTKGTGLTMERTLSGTFAQARQHASQRRVNLYLPRMHLEYSTDLVTALAQLGLGVAFSDRADFGGISDRPMQIGGVIHKTTLDVDEKGTTATAATAVVMQTTAIYEPQQPPVVVRVDHPFFCIVRDDRSGAVLFLGAISNL
jgi:serpin B